jgi:hypothetical protein
MAVKTSEWIAWISRIVTLLLAPFIGILTWYGSNLFTMAESNRAAVHKNATEIYGIRQNRYTGKEAAADRLLEREDMKEFIRLNIDPIHSSLAEIKAAVKENRDAIRDLK